MSAGGISLQPPCFFSILTWQTLLCPSSDPVRRGTGEETDKAAATSVTRATQTRVRASFPLDECCFYSPVLRALSRQLLPG